MTTSYADLGPIIFSPALNYTQQAVSPVCNSLFHAFKILVFMNIDTVEQWPVISFDRGPLHGWGTRSQ